MWTLVAVTVPIALALGLALALNGLTRFARTIKSLFFLPLALSLVVVGQVWIWILKPDDGLINLAVKAVGLPGLSHAWLADSSTALAGVLTAWS